MKQRWYQLPEIREMACPISMGQAEAGRYTFCVGDKCMAWQWMVSEETESKTILSDEQVPEGWATSSAPYKKGKKDVVDIMKKPSHGKCAFVKPEL